MTPTEHSALSCRDFSHGNLDDIGTYLPIHKFLDSTKGYYPFWMHRVILHNSFGMDLCERLFGDYVINYAGNRISVREIARRHIAQDLNGMVPTIKDWFSRFQLRKEHIKEYKTWMNQPKKRDLQWLKSNFYNEPENEKD